MLAKVRGLEGVPALVEVVIPEKDLAPQLKRLAEEPAAGLVSTAGPSAARKRPK